MSDTAPTPTPEETAAWEAARQVSWTEALAARRQAATGPFPEPTNGPGAGIPAAAPAAAGPSHEDVAQMVRDEVAAGLEKLSEDLRGMLSGAVAPSTPQSPPEAPQGAPEAPGAAPAAS